MEHNKPPPSPSPPPFFSNLFHVATSCIYMISLLYLWILIHCLYLQQPHANIKDVKCTTYHAYITWHLVFIMYNLIYYPYKFTVCKKKNYSQMIMMCHFLSCRREQTISGFINYLYALGMLYVCHDRQTQNHRGY